MGEAGEAIGFLCRWSLLALTGAILAAGVLACGLAASDVSQLRGEILVPDAVAAPGRALLRGTFAPVAMVGGSSSAVARLSPPSGPARLLTGSSGGEAVLLWPGELPPGPTRAVVLGNPYGRYAFGESEALLCVIPPHRVVFLVDAAMAAGCGAAAADELRLGIAALSGHGEIAFFHEGPQEAYEAVRDELREAFPGRAVVSALGSKPRPPASLRFARARLGGQRPGAIRVVTAEANLAAQAAGRGFETHLIGADRPPDAPEALKTWISLTEYAASLPDDAR